MADINEALIMRVAELARLELSEAEIKEYVKSIGDILKHVDQLSSVQTDSVEPMFYGVDDSLRLRDDEVVELEQKVSGQPRILDHAPEVIEGGFKVPQVIG